MQDKLVRCKIGDVWYNEKGAKVEVIGIRGSVGILSCSICDNDKELFPRGSITSYHTNSTTWGCKGRGVIWTDDQYRTLIRRKCAEKGFECIEILNNGGKIIGRTKLKLRDKVTKEEWDTTDILHLLYTDQGSPLMGRRSANEVRRKDDEDFIQDFLSTGSFVEGTVFKRDLTIKSKSGRFNYFLVYCPLCGDDKYTRNGIGDGWFRASIERLKKGSIPCRCSGKYKWTSEERKYQVKNRCEELAYEFLTMGEFDGAFTKFNAICDVGHGVNMSVNNFINNKNCCKVCSQSDMGYYPEYEDKEDTLYLMEFKSFIKVGRSFWLKQRIQQLERATGLKSKSISTWSAPHKLVYKVEQEIIKRNVKFSYKFEKPFHGSGECFIPEAKGYIVDEISKCLQEIETRL